MTSMQAPYLQAYRFTNDKHTGFRLINKLHIRGVWRYVCRYLVLRWTNERDAAQIAIYAPEHVTFKGRMGSA